MRLFRRGLHRVLRDGIRRHWRPGGHIVQCFQGAGHRQRRGRGECL